MFYLAREQENAVQDEIRAEQSRTSYWQQGCDDGKAGRPLDLPNPQAAFWLHPDHNAANRSYRNGYSFGEQMRLKEKSDE